MKPKLYYCGQLGEGYGWGTCNTNLSRALGEYFQVLPPPTPKPHDIRIGLGHPVFIPIANHNLEPAGPWRGTKTIGYTFFEYPLGPKAEENAKLYDLIFCGSTWCKERLAERGITNTVVLVQGVDHSIFHPVKAIKKGRFCVFSGGKAEYRKGHDLVIAGFKEFLKVKPDAVLVCAWFNPWPHLIATLRESKYIKWPSRDTYATQEEFFTELLLANDIPRMNFSIQPFLSQKALADVMRCTDVGLFPNRCEGGTNLVMMEYTSCGLPVLATFGTGHKDVLTSGMIGELDERQWSEVTPIQIAQSLNRQSDWCSYESQWTWERAAKTVADAL